MVKLKIEHARHDHVRDIWNILTQSFNDSISEYTAVGQPGYREFLSDFITSPDPGPKKMLVGSIEGKVAAFADVNIYPNAPNFLTRIAVRPEFRGHSIAGQLMRQVQQIFGTDKGWELDVFQSNASALRLYKSRGFKVIAANKWVSRTLPISANDHVETAVHMTPPADDQYLRYGFTNLRLQGHKISVAGKAARCYEMATFDDDVFLMKVKELYPKVDRAFIVLNESSPEFLRLNVGEEIGLSYRLTGSF